MSSTRAISKTTRIIIIVAIIVIAGVGLGAYYASVPTAPAPQTTGLKTAAQSVTPSRQPIKIGFPMGLTGAVAGNGVAALLAMKMWANDTNAHGGLLGRPVQLIYYDDGSTATNDPSIYTKLITVDKVDLLLSGYGTYSCVPGIPIAKQYGKLMIGLFCLGANTQFNYNGYFGIMPAGPSPYTGWSIGLFQQARTLKPAPQTVAIVGIQNPYGLGCMAGASQNALSFGYKLLLNESYPASTTDFTTVITKAKSLSPDIFYPCSYPPDTVGLIRAAKTVNFVPKIFGGGMVGLGYANVLQALGPVLNGIVNYQTWAPVSTLNFPGINQFISAYQPLAAKAGVDVLGYYLPPYAYAEMQVLADAVQATGTLDNTVLAQYLHTHTVSTLVGEITFAANGEWSQPRIFYVQFQGIGSSNLTEFTNPSHWIVLAPAQYTSGKWLYPFSGWG